MPGNFPDPFSFLGSYPIQTVVLHVRSVVPQQPNLVGALFQAFRDQTPRMQSVDELEQLLCPALRVPCRGTKVVTGGSLETLRYKATAPLKAFTYWQRRASA